jgi:hypothetical protein
MLPLCKVSIHPTQTGVNAFGTVKKGSGEIVPYLNGLFADANFDAGERVAPPHSALRILGNDAVAVSTHLQVKGQRLVGGGIIPLRDNYSLRILQKQADGTWLIVSEMYMDARQDQTYAALGPKFTTECSHSPTR